MAAIVLGTCSSGGAPQRASFSETHAATLSGRSLETVSGVPLAGFTVTLGSIPPVATCIGAQTQRRNLCGELAAVAAVTTTASDGTFTVSHLALGTYMLVVGNGSAYATLHRTVTIASGVNVLGTVRLAALSADEQAWLHDANRKRATMALPESFGNLVVDEYAEEEARRWSSDVVARRTKYTDAGYLPYLVRYIDKPGSMYGATGVLDLIGTASAFVKADVAWMAEKKTCPGGNWRTCVRAVTTGHYINVSNTDDVWIGLGESATSFDDPPFGKVWAYDLMLVEQVPATNR